MKRFLFAFTALTVLAAYTATAQVQPSHKKYANGTLAGDAKLLEEWTESDGRQSSVVYLVDISMPGSYFIKVTANMQEGKASWVSADGRLTSLVFKSQSAGWQQSKAEIHGGAEPVMKLAPGRHTLRITTDGNIPPLVDEFSLSRSNEHTKLDEHWQHFSNDINRLMNDAVPQTILPAKNEGTATSKVLSNPEGVYEHEVDVPFTYSTSVWVWLNAGASYTFTTYNSTKDPVLHLFNTENLDLHSWYNDDGGGGYESSLTMTAPYTGTYILLARPYWAGQSGVTNIKQNGVTIYSNTPIAGMRYTTAARTGDLNYFTCKLTGADADTRIFTLAGPGQAVTGYNDDYFNSTDGTWDWNFASRIKKNYLAGSSIVYLCAYKSWTTGTCDVYMGASKGGLPVTNSFNFPLLAEEDAIRSAPSSGVYNCISWSGGITSSWSWPSDPISSWYVPNNQLAGFDNFYSNNPVRYPGAWNLTRSGATAANAVVDLWKAGSYYQHGSVTKPGNDHPHGYDWESKAGSLERQFHPRNALENANCYGFVTDHYRSTGTFASKLASRPYETDADAVAAGIAVYENAKLSAKGNEKLHSWLAKTDNELVKRFEGLYQDWKSTWAANAAKSDPFAYCNNHAFELLMGFCEKNNPAVLPLVFEKFTNGDHLTSKLLWELTRSRYAPLLDEAKKDILDNPYDEKGRFKIHGDHDNGVRYIEKILAVAEITPAETVIVPAFTFGVTASPDPVKDILTIKVDVKTKGRMTINAVSSQTGNNKIIVAGTEVIPGIYQYTLNVKGMAGTTGDLVIVQVKMNGEMKSVKVLVAN